MSNGRKITYVTALQIEARPLIDLLGLKAAPMAGGLRRWLGDEAAVVVTGSGKLHAAIGTTTVLRAAGNADCGLVVNFGLCGAVDPAVPIGTTVLANRVRDVGGGRDWYPEMLTRHDFLEGALATHEQVVTDRATAGAAFVDMEAAGVMTAAVRLVGAAGVIVAKVVSDHLSCTRLEKARVVAALTAAAPGVIGHAETVAANLPERPAVLVAEVEALLAALAGDWRLSVTRQQQLRQAAIGWTVRSGGQPVALLAEAQATEADTREAAVATFNELLEQLHGE